MRSGTHVVAAAALAAASFEAMAYTWGRESALVGAWAIMVGSKAPDWLELKRWAWGKRFSVLPHRTVTHTWWLWVLLWLGVPLWVPLGWGRTWCLCSPCRACCTS